VHYRVVPPTLHVESTNPLIKLESSAIPLCVARSVTALKPAGGAKGIIAGVSSFGFGGTNAHTILASAAVEVEEEQLVLSKTDGAAASSALLLLSAKSEAALRALKASYADWIDANAISSPARLAAMCYGAALRRTHFTEARCAVVAKNASEMATQLRSSGAVTTSSVDPAATTRRAAFLFTGQGDIYTGTSSNFLFYLFSSSLSFLLSYSYYSYQIMMLLFVLLLSVFYTAGLVYVYTDNDESTSTEP
jgi:myxalamid-type polyketide synthase MxaB